MASKTSFLMLALAFTLSSCSHSPKAPVTSDMSGQASDLAVNKYLLDNGLTLLVIKDDRLPVFSYYTLFNVGGRHESEGTTGATHFLEHMMFKGAKKYGPGQFDTLIEANGGSTNAYTTFDNTVYYQSLPARHLETIIDLEADRMENLLLEPASFERERAVVMEERKYRYENSPRGQLYLAMMKAVFEGTPYGGSVIGEFEDLKSLSRDQVMEYFKKFYTPDNAIIVIAGNVDPSDTYSMVKEKFGKLASSTEEVRQYKKNADAPERYKLRSRWNREIRLRGEAQTPQFMMAFPGEAVGTRKAYVMDLLSSLLGSGVSSFFNQEFVKNRSPLLGEISVSSYNLMYNGVFFISGELLSKTNLTSFKSRLERDLKKTCKTAVVDRSVQKGKNQFLVSFFSGMQTNSGLAHSLGLSQLYFADHTHYKKELEIFQSITTQEVMDVCQDLFEKGPSLFLSVWKNHPGH